MRLRVLLPSRVLLDSEVTRVLAEGLEGHFCLLPRHVDYVSALVPGLLSCETPEGEVHLAVDEGILLKRGADVTVATPRAVTSHDLATLRDEVRRMAERSDEQERKTRDALANLEATLVRRFVQLEARR